MRHRAALHVSICAKLNYVYPAELVPDGETPASHLRALTDEPACGSAGREGAPAKVIDAQVEGELALIAKLKYEAFFLTVEDIVRYRAQPGHPLPGPRFVRELRRSASRWASPRSIRTRAAC